MMYCIFYDLNHKVGFIKHIIKLTVQRTIPIIYFIFFRDFGQPFIYLFLFITFSLVSHHGISLDIPKLGLMMVMQSTNWVVL